MKKFNCYYGNTIMGYRLYIPGPMEASFAGSVSIAKPVYNYEKGIDYNCDKKLLKTTYRRRKKVQLPNKEVVMTIK